MCFRFRWKSADAKKLNNLSVRSLLRFSLSTLLFLFSLSLSFSFSSLFLSLSLSLSLSFSFFLFLSLSLFSLLYMSGPAKINITKPLSLEASEHVRRIVGPEHVVNWSQLLANFHARRAMIRQSFGKLRIFRSRKPSARRSQHTAASQRLHLDELNLYYTRMDVESVMQMAAHLNVDSSIVNALCSMRSIIDANIHATVAKMSAIGTRITQETFQEAAADVSVVPATPDSSPRSPTTPHCSRSNSPEPGSDIAE
jgi:hypothetical protein